MHQAHFANLVNQLTISFIKTEHRQILKPVCVEERLAKNRLLIVHKGKVVVYTPHEELSLKPGKVYFFSSGSDIRVAYGDPVAAGLPKGDMLEFSERYLPSIDLLVSSTPVDMFSIIECEVKAYNTVDFFRVLGLPPFEIANNASVTDCIRKILEESHHHKLGKEQLLRSNMITFIIMLLRYITDNKLFLQKMEMADVLMDPRLVKIFLYVRDNLDKDLSNKAIASKVGLSRDYVGQCFKKTMTNILGASGSGGASASSKTNLQRYIRELRIARALELIKTQPGKRIQSIAREVGIRNFAYFCRVFKSAAGLTAKQVQKRARKAPQNSLTVPS